MIDVPVVHSGISTEWGWDGMSILNYVGSNEYFKKSFKNGNIVKSVWFRFWDNLNATLSRLPQIVANGGLGTHADSHLEFYRLYADGNFSGYDVDVFDMALMPHYPSSVHPVDYRNWGEWWFNYDLKGSYSLDTTGDIFGTSKTDTFYGAWVGTPSPYTQYSMALYPWTLLVFKDWSDTEIDRTMNQSSNATLPSWVTTTVSSAKFGFKFYGQPTDNTGSATSWRIDNLDMPNITDTAIKTWGIYPGRKAVYKIVGKETKNGHTYTVVKACARFNIYGTPYDTQYNKAWKKLSMPFFNCMLYGPVVTTGGPVYTAPILTGIHILEVGCEYEIVVNS